ncbi:MAG: DNA polymerase III subunit delta [Alphaproteobacteria bacterium]|nr:MAG: DNA polymerase III subunit delta [Alphaproteobacteria bacterium]
MIVKFEDFEKKPENYRSFRFFLFYGPNYGKVCDCANLTKSFKNVKQDYEVINFFSDEIKKEDLSRIFVESSTPNIFGSKTFLCFHLNSEKISKEIISIISKETNKDLIVVLKCHQLSPRSPLRSFFEKNNYSISVACYEESESEKKTYINNVLQNEGLKVSESLINLLTNNLSNQRLEIKSELEKIIILHKTEPEKKFMHNTFSFISDSLNNDDTRFIFSIASKEKKEFVKNFNKFTDYGSDNMRLITYLLEHFFRLLVIKIKICEGIDVSSAIKQLRPPIFFKNLPEFKQQLKMFSISELKFVIKKLLISKQEFISGKWSSSSTFMLNLILFLSSKFSPRNS